MISIHLKLLKTVLCPSIGSTRETESLQWKCGFCHWLKSPLCVRSSWVIGLFKSSVSLLLYFFFWLPSQLLQEEYWNLQLELLSCLFLLWLCKIFLDLFRDSVYMHLQLLNLHDVLATFSIGNVPFCLQQYLLSKSLLWYSHSYFRL